MPNVIGKDNLPTVESVSTSDLDSLFREYVHLKRNIDDLTARQNVIKKELISFVDDNGLEDDKGHKWYDMAEYNGYNGMQRQRRVSHKLDEQAAHDLLREKGLSARCFELKPVLNQDEVMACLAEGLLTEDDVDTIFPKTVTPAFVLTKA
jgi:hypothetical protein